MTIALRQRPLARVVAGIVSANNGLLFDIGDMSTMFQDTAGTIPVTAVEQPVGKMLDKSGNGYHATQSITASRPTLSARKNILLATEALATQSVTTLAEQHTLSFTGTGSVTLSGTATGALTGTGTSDRVSLTFTPTAGTLTLTVSGIVTKAQLGLGSVVTSYQRVTTATDYDVSAHYYYLRFDGVDDYLNLPYMGLYAGGSASVVAGINGHQFGKAYNGRIICESLVSANAPTYAPLIQLYMANTTNAFITNNAATILADIRLLLTQNDISAISMIDSGLSIKSYKNSAQKSSSAYTRSGTVTLDSTTIGKGMTNGSTEIWKGDLYGLIITKSALTDAQRIKCERFLARKAGVML